MVMGNNKLKSFRQFLTEEDGMGTVEVILIIVVLVGLVIIFKEKITEVVNSIFTKITNQTKKIKGKYVMTSEKKVTTAGSCVDRGLSVSGNLTGNRMRHGYRNG